MTTHKICDKKNGTKRIITVISTIVLCVSGVSIYSCYFHDDPNSSDEESIMRDLLYNDQYTGFNSTISGGLLFPVGIPNDLEYPPLENMTFSIYLYDNIDILSQEYIFNITDRFFPDIDIQNMTQEMKTYDRFDTKYLELSNLDCWIHILSSGAIRYQSKNKLLGKCDNIKSTENATALANDFLKSHGGIPTDISGIDAFGTPMFAFIDDGSRINGSYTVHLYRNISGYRVYGSLLCNDIRLTFDSETQELYDMRWHWPDLKTAFKIENPSKVEDILEHYGMNSIAENKSNITKIQIQYHTPSSIVSGAYDTRNEVYFIAPYLRIDLEDGRYYFLSIKLP
jgi:hypothetical protein